VSVEVERRRRPVKTMHTLGMVGRNGVEFRNEQMSHQYELGDA
jgi:hypothetical protein